MPSEESKKDEQTLERGAAPLGETAKDATDDLDLEELDLSVETVEERISPSETNVFDK